MVKNSLSNRSKFFSLFYKDIRLVPNVPNNNPKKFQTEKNIENASTYN